jgi:predicted DNA-binding transcriptional regulator AlpA
MRTSTDRKPEKRRKPSPEWKRRKNAVPLTERGVLRLPEVADYLSESISSVRRRLKRGELNRLPGSRHILVARGEIDRWIREQTDIANLAA